MNRLRIVLAISSFITLVSAIAAIRDDAAAPAPGPSVVLATLPPPAQPPPPLRLPSRTIFSEPADGSPDASAHASLPAKQDISVGFGILGVSLAGADSVATLLTPNGTTLLSLGSSVNGHRVVDISEAGVRLDNGTVIPRGFGQEMSGGSNAMTVPAISGEAPDDASQNTVQGVPSTVYRSPVTAAPYAPSSQMSRPNFLPGNPSNGYPPQSAPQAPASSNPTIQGPTIMQPTSVATPQVYAPFSAMPTPRPFHEEQR